MRENYYHKIKLIRKQKIAEGIYEFEFDKPAGFSYLAGQFVQFKIPTADSFLLRSYSVSATPDFEHLQFCLKILPEGKGSTWIDKLKIGDFAEISDAKGHFVQDLHLNKYYIATGVGLAPIMAMLESPVQIGESRKLLFGVREESNIFWVNRLDKLKKENTHFDYILTVSRPGESWLGSKGRVTEHLQIDTHGHYYLCGNVQMVKDVRSLLITGGVNTKSIHMEIF